MGHSKVPLHRLISERILRWSQYEAFWVAAALLLRVIFALMLGERFYQADESGFFSSAKHLHHVLVAPNTEAPQNIGSPAAALFWAGFLYFGSGMVGLRLAQAAVSALTAWLIGRLTREATGSRRAGLFALALSTVYPFFVYYSGMLMSETLYLAFVVGGLWAMLVSLQEWGKRLWLAGLFGLCLALAALTRTEAAPIGLVLFLFTAWLCRIKRYSWRAFVAAFLVWLVPLLGWCARNRAHFDRFALDYHGGITLLHGTMLFELDQMDTSISMQAFRFTPLWAAGRELPEPERDRLYFKAGLRFMYDNPSRILRQWALKSLSFWRFYPRTDKSYPDHGFARPNVGASRRMLVVVSLLFEPFLILVGIFGAWRWRRRGWTLFPLYWMVAGTFAIHVVFVSQMRYRLPVMPVLILFACAVLDWFLPKFGRSFRVRDLTSR